MYIVSMCFGIVTISVLCTVIEIKTEVELICLAVCLGLSLEDLVLEQPIFKSAHNKKTTEGFFSSLLGACVLHRGGPGHGTLRWTRTGEQAGKALRSQGHHYARVM